jgi:hypothetical protein
MAAETDLKQVVGRLAVKDERMRALKALEEAGAEGIAAAAEGLSHPDWQVRRWSAVHLDHHSKVLRCDAWCSRLRTRRRKSGNGRFIP